MGKLTFYFGLFVVSFMVLIPYTYTAYVNVQNALVGQEQCLVNNKIIWQDKCE